MRQKPLFFAGLLLAVFLSHGVRAETIYKTRFDKIMLVPVDKSITQGEPVDHPATISEAKVYNMLGSLRFDRRALILKDVEDIRLFDQRGLKLLSPYIAQALQQANSDQMVQFVYIKKAPKWRVFRNDRLISAKLYVRGGEMYMHFTKLYAKIFGDYQRQGKEQRFLQKAKDVRVSLAPKPGQRTLESKFVALKIDHDFKSDLAAIAAEEEAAKQAAEEAEKVRGVPVPDSTASVPKAPDQESEKRLQTLKELRKKKLISEREYQQKRKEIIGEI